MTKNYKSLREYKNQNAEFLSEPIVKSFLNEPENALLLEQSVVQGSEEASLELDKRFSKHFFLYRLIKYISTLSYHYSNDFDKQRRAQKNRFLLLLDKPINNEESNSTSMMEYLINNQNQTFIPITESNPSIFDLVEDDVLYKTLNKLTKKELEVLKFTIIDQMKQIDVSKLYGDTPQNIGKIKRKALSKIITAYKEENHR
ncbi:hypothetical protein [Ferdinandcohnia sp. SAFN-114]|uniref:hypothetical protein n=1 Tax=Ferdinandcohnia sp. SAFN-114 TaxID=3387275 RepID=UPI003F7FF6C8